MTTAETLVLAHVIIIAALVIRTAIGEIRHPGSARSQCVSPTAGLRGSHSCPGHRRDRLEPRRLGSAGLGCTHRGTHRLSGQPGHTPSLTSDPQSRSAACRPDGPGIVLAASGVTLTLAGAA